MSDSDSEQGAPVKPAPKRRRIIFDPSTISSVPIYSNKVKKCLQLKPAPAALAHNNNNNNTCDLEASLCSDSAPPEGKVDDFCFTDSEEEEERKLLCQLIQTRTRESMGHCSPSPPLTPSRPQDQVSTRVWRVMDEVNSRLGAVASLLSPSEGVGGIRTRGHRARHPATAGTSLTDAQYDDDVVHHHPGHLSQPVEIEDPPVAREVQLKFRYRTEIHRVLAVSSRPLGDAVGVLAYKLKVPPSRILLLRNETELPVHSSANQLGLSIADIIDCVVMAEDAKQQEEEETEESSDIITVRLQGKDRGSTRQYSLHKEAPLGTVLSEYTASRSTGSRATLQFWFDGSKIKASHTPAQLDMEDGDVIEVWG